MSVRTTFVSAQPFIIGIGVPIAVLMAGLVLPFAISQGRDIQKILDTLDTVKSDVSDLKKNVDAIDKRERQAETDPDTRCFSCRRRPSLRQAAAADRRTRQVV